MRYCPIAHFQPSAPGYIAAQLADWREATPSATFPPIAPITPEFDVTSLPQEGVGAVAVKGVVLLGGGADSLEVDPPGGGKEEPAKPKPPALKRAGDALAFMRKKCQGAAHSSKIFPLRTVLCLPTYALVPLALYMGFVKFGYASRYMFELLGTLSFCCTCVHHSLIVDTEDLFLDCK